MIPFSVLLGISNGWKTVIMVVAMIIVFYLFLIRPQTQQEKRDAAYRRSLKKGDAIVTNGGVHATFISSDEHYAIIEVAPNVRWKVQLGAIAPANDKSRAK